MEQLTKTPQKIRDEIPEGFNLVSVVVVIFLLVLFVGAAFYVLVSSIT